MRKVFWQIVVHLLAFVSAMVVMTVAFQIRLLKALRGSKP